jgi:copper homeostasis protein
MAADAGADGVVIGVLYQEDNTIDINSLKLLTEESIKRKLSVTFHRAFDAAVNRIEALEVLIDLGINRVLTSGTAWGSNKSALYGVDTLKQIVKASGNKIEIVLGGGINQNNVTEILNHLNLDDNNISVHSYSGVQKNGKVDLNAVKSLNAAVKVFGKL